MFCQQATALTSFWGKINKLWVYRLHFLPFFSKACCGDSSVPQFPHSSLIIFSPLTLWSSLCIRPKLSSLLHTQLSTQTPPHCTHWGTCCPFARGCHNLPASDLLPLPQLCDEPALIFSLHTRKVQLTTSSHCPLPPAAKWQEGKERGIKHSSFGTKQRQLLAASSKHARQILCCVAKYDPGKLMPWLNTALLPAWGGKFKSKSCSCCFILSHQALQPFPSW